MKKLLLIIYLFISSVASAQLPDISKQWYTEYIDILGEKENYETLNQEFFFSLDYSDIISNQLRFKGDGWSTYIGVFGLQNRRIDFHLETSKMSSRSYKVWGKSKLGNNIRELEGTIELIEGFKTNWYAHIMVFKYELNEPGTKDGDGYYVGIGAFAFTYEDDQLDIFWSAAGDFRDYNNMFVGVWKRYDSSVTRDCIFTFHPSGTHSKLPFRDYLYKEFDTNDECKCAFEIKDEYREFGWEDYKDFSIEKTDWWKN